MLFDESDKVCGRVTGERRFREVRICRNEIIGLAIDICKIASPAARNKYFLADALGTFENGDAATALPSFDRAEEAGCSGAEY